jgi:serine/threonine protein kinase
MALFASGDAFEKLRIVSRLGGGHSATVWKVEDGETLRALKVYAPDFENGYPPLLVRRIDLEIIAGAIDHPSVLRVHRKVQGQHNGQDLLGVLMAYVPGTNLSEYIKTKGPLAEHHVRALGYRIVSAVAALHGNGIIHRDIKPANILLNEGGDEPILADLGVVALPGIADAGTDVGDFVGSWRYAAPEYLFRDPAEASDKPEVDVYALGASLYEMILGKRPFENIDNRAQLADAVKSQHLTIGLGTISQDLRVLVARMLAKSPKDRPGLQEVTAGLAKIPTVAGPRPTPADPSAISQRFAASPRIATAASKAEASAQRSELLLRLRKYFFDLWSLRVASTPLKGIFGVKAVTQYHFAPLLDDWRNHDELARLLPGRSWSFGFGLSLQVAPTIAAPIVIYFVEGTSDHLEINRIGAVESGQWRFILDTLSSWSGTPPEAFEWFRTEVEAAETLLTELLDTLNVDA